MIPGQSSASVERPKPPAPKAGKGASLEITQTDKGEFVVKTGPNEARQVSREEAKAAFDQTFPEAAAAPAAEEAPAERPGVRYDESVAPVPATGPAFAQQN